MSNARENRIKQLEEELAYLRGICARQQETISTQQEAIVHLNIRTDSTMACLANIYGETVTLEDGRQARRAKMPQKDYHGVLDNFDPSVVREGEYEDGFFVITVAPRAGEAANDATV